MIRNIIFDLGGVLLDVDMKRTFNEFQELGIDTSLLTPKADATDTNTPQATICEGMSVNGIMAQYQTGDIPTDEFFSAIQKACRPGTTIGQVRDAWNSCLFSIPQRRMDAVLRLRQKYNVYMLSNTNDAHWVYLLQHQFANPGADLATHFDRVFVSQEMHLAKPNPEIFRVLLREIDAQPSECLFLDDASVNTAAAAALGIHTLTVEASQIDANGNATPPSVEWMDIIDDALAVAN